VVARYLTDFETVADHFAPAVVIEPEPPFPADGLLEQHDATRIRRRDVTPLCEDHCHHQIGWAFGRQWLAQNTRAARKFPSAELQAKRKAAQDIAERGWHRADSGASHCAQMDAQSL